MKNRKNYLKDNIPELKHPVYFCDDYRPLVTIIENKPIEIEGVKKGSYYANNIGQVFNNKGKEIKPDKINTGYYNYRLVTGNKKGEGPKYKHILSERLFMSVFNPIENQDKMTVNHKNMNKADNRLSNLEWVTQKKNNDEKQRNLVLDGTNMHNAAFTYNDLKIIIDNLDKGLQYSEILHILNMPDTKNYRDYIGNIKRGITYKREVNQILNDRGSTTNL